MTDDFADFLVRHDELKAEHPLTGPGELGIDIHGFIFLELEVELDDVKPKKKGEKKAKNGDNNVVSLEQFRKDKK